MYYIPTGYMYDSDGDTSTAVSYSLTQTATGCTVTVTADAEWINSTERSFPVVIDPSVIRTNHCDYSNIKDVDISSAYSASQSTSSWAQMYVGNKSGHEYNSLIGIKELPEIPKASAITQATLTLKSIARSGTPIVAAYAVTSSWESPTVRWSDDISHTEEVIDYQKIQNIGKEYVFDITSLVQDWYRGTYANKTSANGIILKTYPDTANAYASFSTVNNSAAANNYRTPLFVIHYRDTKGLDGRWTYNSQSAGGAGTGSVNLFTGNLVFIHDDITTNGEILPLTVSHVYNSHQAAQQYEYRKDTINNSTSVYGGATVGNGFKLSVQETIAVETIDSNTWYVYNDADGTELYFYNFKGGTEYISEDGLDLTITKSGGIYTMSDSVGNTKKFNSSGMLYEQQDLHGNKKTITYEDGRITSITHTPKNGTENSQLSFHYNDAGALILIKNNESVYTAYDENGDLQTYEETVSFEYSAEFNGTPSPAVAGYLRTITYSKGSGSCSFEYNSDGRLIVAKDTTTNAKLQYEYNEEADNGYATVSAVSELNGFNEEGQRIGFIYGVETTAVRTSGKDDYYGTSDDLLTHYVFDNHGRTISAYSTNLAETEVYGASNAEYSPTEQGSKKNNTITKDSVSGVPAINLLKNHSAESDTNWIGYSEGTGYSYSHVSNEHFAGNHSYKLSSTTNKASGLAEYKQTITVTEKSYYTFSAYVKTENLDANTGVYLKLGNTSSRTLKTNTNTEIQRGWQRLSVTAELEPGTYAMSAVLEKAIGTVYVDCLQFEKGNGASKYNLVENGSIQGATDGWTASGNIYSDGRIHLSGDPSTTVIAEQTIQLNLPMTTTFILSGWAEANSVARRLPESEDDTPERNFDIVATLTYDNGDTEDTAVSFNTDSTALQFASGAVVAKEKEGRTSITSVKVAIHYDYNANDAYFDNICLAMEPAQTYSYDSEGNLTSATNADGNKIGAEYDSKKIDLLSYTNIAGEKFTYEYTSPTSHILEKIIKSDGNGSILTTEYEYDTYGNVKKETISGANVSGDLVNQTSHDSYGRVQSTTDSLGNVTTYNRDSAAELLNYVMDAKEGYTIYDYDDKERLTSIFLDEDGDGDKADYESSVVYDYNDQDQLVGINNGSTTYTFTYNRFGNLASIKAGNYTLATYNYSDTNGKLMETAYGNMFAVSNVYDSLDRLVKVTYTIYGRSTTAYTVHYNGDGAIAKVVDNRSGITTEYDYDSLGRLIYAVEYETSSKAVILGTENKYDPLGRPEGSKYDLPALDIFYDIEYKQNSNLISKFEQTDSLNDKIDGKYYTYDSLERVTSITTVIDGVTAYTESYTYVSKNTNTSSLVATHTVDGVVYAYTYDVLGNITSVRVDGSLKYEYSYDKLGQLVDEKVYSNSGVEVYGYVYDESGNILAKHRYYGENLNNTDTITYSYGNSTWGDLLTNYNGTAITYDAIGNPLKWHNASVLEWVGRQLNLIGYSDGSVTNFVYNADGIRTEKWYFNAGGSRTGIVKYTLDGSTIVAENRNGTNIYYTYDDKGAIMGMIYGGHSYLFSKNLQGDVIGIYNEDGNLVAKYEYSAYGEITAITDASGNDVSGNTSHIANINPFRYRGYYYDTETGFYYLQSRYYDPVVGRFLNADAIEYLGTGEFVSYNLFAYCGNNPVMGYDPLGTFNFWKIAKGVGRIVTGIVAVAVGAAVCVAGAPAAMIAVAAVTITAGTLTAVNGAADIQQAVTTTKENPDGENFVRDTLFDGNQTAYDVYSGATETVAVIGSAVCGNYVSNTCTMKGAVPGTEGSMKLEPGMTLDRYGSQFGRYLTDPGTHYSLLDLPASNSLQLNSYRVLKGFRVSTGIVANGGGFQYFSWMSVKRLVQFGFLELL